MKKNYVCLHFDQLDEVTAGWSEEQKMRFFNELQNPAVVFSGVWFMRLTGFGMLVAMAVIYFCS